MAMTAAMYLKALNTYATLINANKKTVSDIPEEIISGSAQGIINCSYIIDDVPEILQKTVQNKITEFQSA